MKYGVSAIAPLMISLASKRVVVVDLRRLVSRNEAGHHRDRNQQHWQKKVDRQIASTIHDISEAINCPAAKAINPRTTRKITPCPSWSTSLRTGGNIAIASAHLHLDVQTLSSPMKG
jgi:hypothetical protein